MMKTNVLKRGILLLALTLLMTVLCSCIRTDARMEVKRNGSAAISAVIFIDDESLKDTYGMPTNFYDAVEKDPRFVGVREWKKEYINESIDGTGYTGVKMSGEFSEKEIPAALSALYGNYASAEYSDKNTFGTRTIHLKLRNTGKLAGEELAEAVDKGLYSELKITIPGTIKEITGATATGDNTVTLDTSGLFTGDLNDAGFDVTFRDFTFFIPLGIVLAVVIAAAVVLLRRVNHNISLKKGSSSIKLDRKSIRARQAEKPEPSKPQLSFTKKSPPKYEPTQPVNSGEAVSETVTAAPTAVPAPADTPAPAVTPAPAAASIPAPAVTSTPTVTDSSYRSAALMLKQTSDGSLSESGYTAGSARFSKEEGGVSKLSTGSTLFTPRSTAPNLAYGMEGYEAPHKETEQLHTGSTLFTPRSTAANLEYGKPGYHEEHEQTEQLHTGSTLFTPRSTAPNMDYGIKKDVSVESSYYDESSGEDPFYHAENPAAGPSFAEPKPQNTYEEPSYEQEEYNYDQPYAEANPIEEEAGYQSYEPAYEQPAYDTSYDTSHMEASYEEPAYETSYEESAYEEPAYEEPAYAEPAYEEPAYEEQYYEEPAPVVTPMDVPTIQPIEQGSAMGSIYQTNGYESSAYESASAGASERSSVIKDAYGGSKLGSGAYVGGGTTGMKVGRSVGNIGGYVDETMVNTSSYGSDPFSGGALPKLGESGLDGGGMFSFDSAGGFGGSFGSGSFGGSSYEGNTIGEGTFGSSKYQPKAQPQNSSFSGSTSFEQHTEVSSAFGKRFNTGGTGKFDFGMASSDTGRKCPFCKEPIRDDDLICVACGAALGRPYGSF